MGSTSPPCGPAMQQGPGLQAAFFTPYFSDRGDLNGSRIPITMPAMMTTVKTCFPPSQVYLK